MKFYFAIISNSITDRIFFSNSNLNHYYQFGNFDLRATLKSLLFRVFDSQKSSVVLVSLTLRESVRQTTYMLIRNYTFLLLLCTAFPLLVFDLKPLPNRRKSEKIAIFSLLFRRKYLKFFYSFLIMRYKQFLKYKCVYIEA